MFKAAVSFTALCLLVWVLPLGAFIRSSQEKTACGGKRGMHMCSMMGGKAKPASDGKIAFTSASSAEKTSKSSASGSGDDFLNEQAPRSLIYKERTLDFSDALFPAQPFIKIEAPPPRAAFIVR